jgi:hypothetical protein
MGREDFGRTVLGRWGDDLGPAESTMQGRVLGSRPVRRV